MLRQCVIVLLLMGCALTGVARNTGPSPQASGQQQESLTKAKAEALLQQGSNAFEKVDYAQAIKEWEQALVILCQLPGTEKEQADCLQKIGVTLINQRRHDEAREQLESALQVYRKAPGTEKEQSYCIRLIGNTFWYQRRYGESLAQYEAALAIIRKLPDSAKDCAHCLCSIGLALSSLGHHAEGLRQMELANELYRKLPGTEKDQALCLENISMALGGLGRKDEVLKQYEAALVLYRKASGTERDQARCLACLASALGRQGRIGEQLEQYQAALEIWRKLPGTEINQAYCLINIGKLLKSQKRPNEALEQCEAAMALCRKLPRVDKEQARCMEYIIGLLDSLGCYAEEQKLSEEVLEIYRKLPGTEKEQAYRLHNIGGILMKQGRYSEAQKQEQSALEIFSKLPGTEKEQTDCLINIGVSLDQQDRHSNALEKYKAAAGIFGRLPGKEREQAQCLGSIGLKLHLQRHINEAVEWYEAALTLWRKLPGTEKDQANCLLAISSSIVLLSRYTETVEMRETALELFRKLPGTEERQAYCHRMIGVTLGALGRYGEAMEHHKTALVHYRKLPGWEREQAVCVENIGGTLYCEGRYGEALKRYEEALAIYRKLPGKENDLTRCLKSSGDALFSQGRYSEALEKYDEALVISRKLGLGQNDILRGSGLALCELGRYEEGLERQKAALENWRTGRVTERYQTDCLRLMGEELDKQGRHGEALEKFNEALALYRKLPEEEWKLAACLLSNISLHEASHGQTVLALSTLLEAHRSSWDFFIPNLPSQTQAQKETFFRERFLSHDALYQLALKAGQADAGLEAALLYKNLIEEVLQQERRAFLRHATPELRKEFLRLERLRRQWATLVQEESGPLIQRALGAQEIEWADADEKATQTQVARRQRLTMLQDQISSGEQALARRNLAFARQMTLRRVTTQTLHQSLDGLGYPAVLVEYAKYQPVEFPTGKPSGEPHYAAFILRQGDGGSSGMDLGPAPAIDDALAAWRTRIEQVAVKAFVSTEDTSECLGLGLTLRRLVFDPLASHLGGCKRLIIAPDEQLHQLPFEALPAMTDRNGMVQGVPGRYLLDEGYAISYLSSGRDLAWLAQGQDEPSSASMALIVASPDFDLAMAEQARLVRQLAQTEPPATAPSGMPPTETDREVAAVNQRLLHLTLGLPAAGSRPGFFRKIEPGSFTGQLAAALRQSGQFSGVEITTGAQALEWRLKHLRQSPRLLQVLTHGLYLAPPEQQDQVTSSPAGQALANPLLRSLLAMASANNTVRGEHAPEGADDGLLTAYEVAGLDLKGCELVALAACQSALGQTLAGRSVGGLRWAFMQAGARSLLASQWSAPELASREQMQSFYRLWLDKEVPRSRYEAFLESQRQALQNARMLERSSHPWLWAGFVYIGAPDFSRVATGVK